jgi:endonuclease YncB( thermonuclease family)
MAVIRFSPKRSYRRRRKVRWSIGTPLSAAAALIGVCALGWASADQNSSNDSQLAQFTTASEVSAVGRRVHFNMCGRNRYTCVVDGDTIWLDGQNLRLQSYDTPEPYNDICGGQAEVALAKRASARLLDLLNANPFTVDTAGHDRYGRTLATIRIGGRDVGDILINEGLARRWPNGREFWC